MVASLKAVTNPHAAAGYFSRVDDYYREQAQAPTAWMGKGAEALGLAGAVDPKAFQQLLEGRLPNDERLGRQGPDGKTEHKPGWDLTFSAPKSVSIMALVAGDDRLVAAHESAIRETLAWLEKEVAVTRVKQAGEVSYQRTGNLVAASFRHATSREQDPQLHNHVVIMNATQREDGKWRSLESRALYRLQLEAGERYRATLAVKASALGYAVERTKVAEMTGFELADVPVTLRDHFAERSRQIEAALAERGKTLETATPDELEMAKLATRKNKEAADHADLRAGWQAEAAPFADLAHIKNAAQAQAMGPVGPREQAAVAAADAAVSEAAQHLAERESRFSRSALLSQARGLAMGQAGEADLVAAVARAEKSGDLASRQVQVLDPVTGERAATAGYATREGVQTELLMLAAANRAAGKVQPLSSNAAVAQARQEAASGFKFNKSQAAALKGILENRDRVHLVQGLAGTAKTTSVLAALAAEARAQGHAVVALAPTASAAGTLGAAIKAEGATVAKHLNTHKLPEGGVWVVDEASLLAARDAQRLLALAEQKGARLVMVGDVQQLGAVEAGVAFRQLQTETRLKTHVLDEIVRQQNQTLREAVYDALKGNAAAALEKIHTSGGSVTELASREERVVNIAKAYASQTAEKRAASMVIAPGRDDRALLNDAIRAELKAAGVVAESELSVDTLVRKDLTQVAAKRAENYNVGDVLRAGRDYLRHQVAAGDHVRVVSVDARLNRLTLETAEGRRFEVNPRVNTRWQAFEAENRQVAAGDRITFRANDAALGRVNGASAEVVAVDAKVRAMEVRHGDGRVERLSLDAKRDAHWSHAYAQTVHEAQGRTCDRVWVHAESGRVNLTNLEALYVAISRAKHEAHVVTDSREALGFAASQAAVKTSALMTKQERGWGASM